MFNQTRLKCPTVAKHWFFKVLMHINGEHFHILINLGLLVLELLSQLKSSIATVGVRCRDGFFSISGQFDGSVDIGVWYSPRLQARCL